MKSYLIFILILFVGCSSLPIIESRYNENDIESSVYHYDIENNLAYKIKHDNEYIYLHLKTDDKTTIRKIMMNGLYIYMDPQGGRSKEVYFNYPLSLRVNPQEMKKRAFNQGTGMNDEFDMNRFLDHVSMEAIYSNHDLAEKMPVYSSKTDFKVELSAPTPSIFVYDLRIPFSKIHENGQKGISKLSLGIMTGKVERPSMEGRPGGGMPSGSRPGGGMGGGPGGGFDREEMMEQMSIWFQLALNNTVNE
ncbi:MAG: hypothetical protein U9O95_08920 [Candidatus Marinimicrobia bacterium]|nr:hypothetical protein [Candidatus Neomarinimicrobiota bacterium]